MDTPPIQNLLTADKDWSDYNSWDLPSPSTSFGAVNENLFFNEILPAQNEVPFNWDAGDDGSLSPLFYDTFLPESPLLQPQWPLCEPAMRQEEMKLEEENQETVVRDCESPSLPIGCKSSSSQNEHRPPPLVQQRKGGKIQKMIEKPKRKYLYEFDPNDVTDKKLKTRILKAKKCKDYRDNLRQKATIQEPCLCCLEKLNGNRRLFEVLQQLLTHLSMSSENVEMGEDLFGSGGSFDSLQ